ncbi:hypothetical protein L204_102864 [Cryptococcus depauperatus]|nr:hypothetical protein L204_00389 [Cryptococcus depauperatus CBS 7855]
MPPQLLYHSSNPTLYPTTTLSALLVLRFHSPVRVSSVRITPEGVRCLDSVGVTYPPEWSGQLLFNVTSSKPINALVSTFIKFQGEELPVEYPIDMPVGVASRMMMLRAPVDRLSISVYGYTDADGKDSWDYLEPMKEELIAIERSEDFSWLWSWAGGSPIALLDILNPYTPESSVFCALECLNILSEVNESIFETAVKHRKALEYLSGRSSSPFYRKLLNKSRYALDPSMMDILPNDSPYKPFSCEDNNEKYAAAWKYLELGQPALQCLVGMKTTEEDLTRVEAGMKKSNLARIIDLGEQLATNCNGQGLGLILDILRSTDITTAVTWSYLARIIPKLTAICNTILEGQEKSLCIPIKHAEEVVRTLFLVSSEVVGGKLVFPAAKKLAVSYVYQLDESDPIRVIFIKPSQLIPPPNPSYDNPTTRALSRLAKAINCPSNSPSTVIHSLTPSSLLTFITPLLAESLSTALVPPFGLTPCSMYTSPEGQGASAWAGKVYTEHEFRSRDLVGLGVPQTGRAASKHVDEYA